MIRIILIEDDDELRKGMQEYLELSGFLVTAVGKGIDFFNVILQQSFDVAIVDLGLPDFTGQQLIEYLRRHSTTAVIVLTASNNLGTRIESYQLGADLFMNKPVDAGELIAAVNSLASRRLVTLPTVTTAQQPAVWIVQRSLWTLVSPCGTAIKFTGKEFKFIEQLIMFPSKTINRQQACIALYGRNDDSAQAALLTLIKRVRQRIAQSGIQEQPIQTEHGLGYRFTAPFKIV